MSKRRGTDKIIDDFLVPYDGDEESTIEEVPISQIDDPDMPAFVKELGTILEELDVATMDETFDINDFDEMRHIELFQKIIQFYKRVMRCIIGSVSISSADLSMLTAIPKIEDRYYLIVDTILRDLVARAYQL